MEEMGLSMSDDKPRNDDSSGNDGTTASSNSGNANKGIENDFEFNSSIQIKKQIHSGGITKKNSAQIENLESELETMRLELEEQALVNQMNASNMVAAALIAQEGDTQKLKETIEEKSVELKGFEDRAKEFEQEMNVKDQELSCYRL